VAARKGNGVKGARRKPASGNSTVTVPPSEARAGAPRPSDERPKEYYNLSWMRIEPLYTEENVAPFDYATRLNEPGKFPFTRGVHPTMYRGRLWTMRMFAGFGTAEETNQRFKFLLQEGQTGLSTAFDLPTLYGYDADHEMSEGEVGKCGVAVSSLEDMMVLFDGIPRDLVTTSMTINAPAAVVWAMYIAAGEASGVPRAKLGGTIQNDILKEYQAQKEWIFPPEPHMRLVIDTIEFGAREMPRWNPVSISGYHIREAGSSAVQELAFTLNNGREYVRRCVERGLDVDDFAPRLSFFFNAHNDFFEEIAKYRAARRIWAKVMKDEFGAKKERSMWCRFHTQTAGCSLTAQQPEINVVRTTLQALAAVLGGTQSLHTNSLDEALALPTENAVRIALRTQQIIAYESGVADSIDPLGGSYYVEWLTDRMEEEAFKYFDRIDDLGGVLKGIDSGFFQKEIADSAYRYQREVEVDERVIVGVNRYVADAELQVPILKINEAARDRQIARLKKLRAKRDGKKCSAALDALTKACEREEGEVNLMGPLLDAVSAWATLGEICDTMKEVFGEYREPAMF
jgi:methylmalonyl-CoA mutase N-terminal domain/subunit